jgi:YebC/PmpR family DNA-binding regulatory protein
MAGHSKWANIKHQKARVDAKRGKIFTRLIRDVLTAARHGGGDINSNPTLRLAVETARKNNMTKDTIERAIKRGTGEIAGDDYVEKVYEGYGPAGVAIIVKTLTDNGTRTFTNVRTAFNKNNGNLGTDGSVAWMFEERGMIQYPVSIGNEDDVMEAAIEAGAADFEPSDEVYTVYTEVPDFGEVRNALVEKYGDPAEADLTFVPKQTQPVADAETAQKVMKLVDVLEEDDDVQNVIVNMELDDAVAEALAS